METETREELREWLNQLSKLDEKTKKREAIVWCLSALSILERDKNFQSYCKERGINENNTL